MNSTRGQHSTFRALMAPVAICVLSAVPAAGQPAESEKELPFLPAKKANKLVVDQPIPEYPTLAKMNYIQGNVRLLATVNDSGDVAEAHVVRGHPFLAVAALRAVRRWLFRPAGLRPGPAQFMTYVDVNFSLRAKRIDQIPSDPERDLRRQIRPPEILDSPSSGVDTSLVRMRVLVSSDGQVLDAQPLGDSAPHFEEARRIVASWSFRPARWGALSVPWFLEVDVPVQLWPLSQGAADPGER